MEDEDRYRERLRKLELEEQDRRGYLAQPQREDEIHMWEDIAAWPEGWVRSVSRFEMPTALS